MRRLWRRWRRLTAQSRITLPRRGLAPSDLRTGDWVEVASAAWRVAGRVLTPLGGGFLLEPRSEGGVGARLLPPAAGAPWRLVQGEDCLELRPEDILAFPAAATRDG